MENLPNDVLTESLKVVGTLSNPRMLAYFSFLGLKDVRIVESLEVVPHLKRPKKLHVNAPR